MVVYKKLLLLLLVCLPHYLKASVLISIDTGTLSSATNFVEVSINGKLIRGKGSISLDDGNYELLTRVGSYKYGEITVLGGKVVEGRGAVNVVSDTLIDFDISRLKRVTVDPRVLSNPLGRTEIIIPAVSGLANFRLISFYVPDGIYEITNKVGNQLGIFSIEDGALSSSSNRLSVQGSEAVQFELDHFSEVVINSSALSSVSGSYVLIPEINSRSFSSGIYYLVDGTYDVKMWNGVALGSFNIQNAGQPIVSGGYLSSSMNEISIDAEKLLKINVRYEPVLLKSGIYASELLIPSVFGGLSFYDFIAIPNGAFEVFNRKNEIVSTINVNNGIATTSGLLTLTEGSIGIDKCAYKKLAFEANDFEGNIAFPEYSPVSVAFDNLDYVYLENGLREVVFTAGGVSNSMIFEVGEEGIQPNEFSVNGVQIVARMFQCDDPEEPELNVSLVSGSNVVMGTDTEFVLGFSSEGVLQADLIVNFGDSTEEMMLSDVDLSKNFSFNHTYANEGTFELNISLSNESGFIRSFLFEIIANSIGDQLQNVGNAIISIEPSLNTVVTTVVNNTANFSTSFGYGGQSPGGIHSSLFWSKEFAGGGGGSGSGGKKGKKKRSWSRKKFGGGWGGTGISGWYSPGGFSGLSFDDLRNLLNPETLRATLSNVTLAKLFDPINLVQKFDIDILELLLPPQLVKDILKDNPFSSDLSSFNSWKSLSKLASSTKRSLQDIKKDVRQFRKMNKSLFKGVERNIRKVKDFTKSTIFDELEENLNVLDVESFFKEIVLAQVNGLIEKVGDVVRIDDLTQLSSILGDVVIVAKALSGDPNAILETSLSVLDALEKTGIVSPSVANDLREPLNNARTAYLELQYAPDEISSFRAILKGLESQNLLPANISQSLLSLVNSYSDFLAPIELQKHLMIELIDRAIMETYELKLPVRVKAILVSKLEELKIAVRENNIGKAKLILESTIDEIENSLIGERVEKLKSTLQSLENILSLI